MKAKDFVWLHQLVDPFLISCAQIGQEGLAETPESLEIGQGRDRILAGISLFVDRLLKVTLENIPTTVRSLLYALTDCVDAQARRTAKIHLLGQENRVTPSAIAICSQLLLSNVIGAFTQEARVASRAQTTSGRQGSKSSDAAALAAEHTLRQLGHFVWDRSVWARNRFRKASARIPQGTSLQEESEIDRVDSEENKKMTEFADKITTWMAGLLVRPRIHSPMRFSGTCHPAAGYRAVRTILEHLLLVDKRLQEGTFDPRGGLTVEDVTKSPHFEDLIAFAVMHGRETNPEP
eukprot:GHVT01087921.1.p1 GENE.GHVT01087921.1~~GHVT01087921.1.p1  ORF type:complete len:292 (+),score=17.77 GHVT01087921.1:4260-5135(+)